MPQVIDFLPIFKKFYDQTFIKSYFLDNPYNAAQEFIRANELPQDYLDQVADFIIRNTQGVSLGAESQYVDPFTGTL